MKRNNQPKESNGKIWELKGNLLVQLVVLECCLLALGHKMLELKTIHRVLFSFLFHSLSVHCRYSVNARFHA